MSRRAAPLRVLTSVDAWTRDRPRGTLGFVPTMGALHAGHRGLIERSVAENDFTLVSIFVNPTQFNNPQDLETYPRTLESDEALMDAAGADFVLIPQSSELYRDGYRYRVSETEQSRILEGVHRPGHFDGMLTVVLKLLLIARADRAYFGEKDYQQLLLVRGLVDAFFLPTQIVSVATVREPDGLAMSSRNRRLSESARKRAAELHRILREADSPESARDQLARAGFTVDYVEERFGRRLAAAHLDGVRLIDNEEIR